MHTALDYGQLMTFGQCLKSILKEKRMSASALSRLMEDKSRNSLFRILDDTSSPSAQALFYEKLIRQSGLDLTQGQRVALEQALEVSRVGEAEYRSNQAMGRLLRGDGAPACGRPIRVDTVGGTPGLELSDQLALYARGREVSVTITGCCDRGILQAVADGLVYAKGACNATITHYLYTGGDEITKGVSAIQPLLYEPCYMGYWVEPGAFSAEREQIYRANNIAVRWADERGCERMHMFSLIDRNRLLLVEQCDGRNMELIERIMQDDRRRMQPLKSSFMCNHSPDSCIAYAERCGELEYGRAVYAVRSDVPVHFIAPDALARSAAAAFQAEQGVAKPQDAILRVHQRRYDHFYRKKKPTHIILTMDALRRLARVGAHSGHFPLMGPYPPWERVSILRCMRRQAEENPSVNLYLFKDDFALPHIEIGLYEGAGTLISRPFERCGRAGGHADALITQREFCEKFKAFFVDDLLVRRVMTQAQTIATLDALIADAQASA